MSTYEFRDESGDARLIGTLHAEGGATGDVPTQQASGVLAQAVPGGSTPGEIVRGPFPFTFATANLNAGVQFYVPTVGDLLIDAWFEIPVDFDGTTPLGDFGYTGVNGGGFFGSGFTGQTDMTANSVDLFNGGQVISGTIGDNLRFSTTLGANSFAFFPTVRFTSAAPLSVWVSQNGTSGGAAPGGTQGTANLYIVTATPVALP